LQRLRGLRRREGGEEAAADGVELEYRAIDMLLQQRAGDAAPAHGRHRRRRGGSTLDADYIVGLSRVHVPALQPGAAVGPLRKRVRLVAAQEPPGGLGDTVALERREPARAMGVRDAGARVAQPAPRYF